MAQDIIRIGGRHYILASSPRINEEARVLKHGDTFAVFDPVGDIRPIGRAEEGLYHAGTRHLSELELNVCGQRPILLSSTVRRDNSLLAVDLCNADLQGADGLDLPRDVLHVFRSVLLWRGTCYVHLRVRNYHDRPVAVSASLGFRADFRDLFEVRGERRERRGDLHEPVVTGDAVELSYQGLDGVGRRTRLLFDAPPDELAGDRARIDATLAPQDDANLFVSIQCEHDAEPAETRAASVPFNIALARATEETRERGNGAASISTSNDQLNSWIDRSGFDVRLMMTDTALGPYPYAGIPWYSTPFGRDGLITALEYLWVDPGVARGVLNFLARTQADTADPRSEAQPGRIVHEMRHGEMAALGEVPFARYYGTVDATPLFVMLAGAYYRRTADREFVRSIWPNVERALAWIDDYGDIDGDGFVEYAASAEGGLVAQGWKDSFDAIHHADGSLAESPIALCEVQGYVFAAKHEAALLADHLGQAERARQLRASAEALQERFDRAFWSEELGTFALALDRDKQPCLVQTSNAGHCLFTGIARADRAERVAATLLAESSFSGWGIRTVARTAERYNPMSYHNGSIWPHDNALIATGFGRYGLERPLHRVFGGLCDLAAFADLDRMPELICGFTRRPDEGPTLYPVACAPQTWAAASVFPLLAACAGLEIDALERRAAFRRPALPPWLKKLEVRDLRVGDAVLDFELRRYPNDVGLQLTRREGDIEVVLVK